MVVLFIHVSYYLTDLKGSIRKLENENADLRFLNNQYVHKIRALEKESKQKTDKMLLLQEKNFHAVVHTPGNRDPVIALLFYRAINRLSSF